MAARAAAICFLLGTLTACERNDEIKVYRLVKPTGEPAPMAKDSIASTNAPVSSTIQRVSPPRSDVATPPNWEPQPLSEMRQASFLVHGEGNATADVSLVKLGPAAGDVLDNVNRWLGQLGQPPVTAEKLATMLQKIPTPRGEVEVVDLSGKPEDGDASKDGRIIAGIALDNGTSFYKLRGNTALVGAEKENFLKWIEAMRSDSESAALNPPAASPLGNMRIKWDTPPGWTAAPPSAMRYASFTTPDKVDISVVTFPGEGGDDLGNVNRWRQQIGLPPTETANITPLKSGETTFATVDLAGENARTLAAWTRKDGQAWFFKLTGPNLEVEKEKPDFVNFVRSVRF